MGPINNDDDDDDDDDDRHKPRNTEMISEGHSKVIADNASGALQSWKWQLIGMSQWCCSALCGHPLPALTDNWTHGAASRHTIAPQSATLGLHPVDVATTHFPSR